MQNRIVFITGRKGSGKTTRANEIAQSLYYAHRRVIILSPMGGFDLPGCPYVRSIDELVSSDLFDRSFIVEPGFDPRLPDCTFLYAYTAGDCVLVVDEVDIWTNVHDCNDHLLDTIRYGRHRELSLIAISQRPANVIRDLTAQSDYLVMFQSTENRDIEYLAGRIGRENGEVVRALDQFQSVTFSAFEGGLTEGGIDMA